MFNDELRWDDIHSGVKRLIKIGYTTDQAPSRFENTIVIDLDTHEIVEHP